MCKTGTYWVLRMTVYRVLTTKRAISLIHTFRNNLPSPCSVWIRFRWLFKWLKRINMCKTGTYWVLRMTVYRVLTTKRAISLIHTFRNNFPSPCSVWITFRWIFKWLEGISMCKTGTYWVLRTSDADIVSRLRQSDQNGYHALFVTTDYPSIMGGHIANNIQPNKLLCKQHMHYKRDNGNVKWFHSSE